jgi:hypothetical protein
MPLRAGAARRVINCEVGDDICGQLHRRRCEFIRDDLEANLLYLEGEGGPLLFVSLDLIYLPSEEYDAEVRRAIEAAAGVPAARVLLCCTHTHTGPVTFSMLGDSPLNEAYLRRLPGWLADGAREAVAAARPARVGWAEGEARIGYNRRLCFADGDHTMYGETGREDFTGLEGPDDPRHAVLFARDAEDDRLLGVLHGNCCHAICVGGGAFASADFPGEARRRLREAHEREDLPVLYLQGASGDTSPWPLQAPGARRQPPQRLAEIGALLAAETLRLLRETPTTDTAPLGLVRERLPVGVRLPDAETLARARALREAGPAASPRREYVLLVDGALRLHEEFRDRPEDALPLAAARVGGFAVAANPCELYCRFGRDIKRRSPFPVTAVAQLTGGSGGYCPTVYAVLGGGYSGAPTHWTRLAEDAGYRLVDAASRHLHRLWRHRNEETTP